MILLRVRRFDPERKVFCRDSATNPSRKTRGYWKRFPHMRFYDNVLPTKEQLLLLVLEMCVRYGDGKPGFYYMNKTGHGSLGTENVTRIKLSEEHIRKYREMRKRRSSP